MKLVTYQKQGGDLGAGKRRIGVISERGNADSAAVIDLSLAFRWLEQEAGRSSDAQAVAARYGDDMLGLIEHAAVALPAVRQVLAAEHTGHLPSSVAAEPISTQREHVQLLAPIPRPVSMRDGYAFRQHVAAARRNRGLDMIPAFDEIPIFYYTNHLTVVGPGPVRVRPLHLDGLDFELEAAVVLGKTLRDADVATADEAIFGLMVMNDLSARGLQMHEMQLNLGPAKGKDFATGLGPYLVPREDLASVRRSTPHGDQYALPMVARHNGEEVARGQLADMHWTFAQIISRASYGVTLHLGEVIGSGTVGTGCFLETNGSKVFHNRWLKDGDVIECEIAELGCLSNTIALDRA